MRQVNRNVVIPARVRATVSVKRCDAFFAVVFEQAHTLGRL
jgi:hypothetical protein